MGEGGGGRNSAFVTVRQDCCCCWRILGRVGGREMFLVVPIQDGAVKNHIAVSNMGKVVSGFFFVLLRPQREFFFF